MPDELGDRPPRHDRLRLWPLYLGGFLGPFGGGILGTMLPELAHGLDTTVSAAGAGISAYLVPLALLTPFAGVLAARWGPERTVRRAYLLYVLASVACALAPTFEVFFGARALQGTANAFTAPLLITMIAERVPPDRTGRSLGTYIAMQGAGTAFAPFVGGLMAEIDYRLAFVVIAVAAVALTVATPGPRGSQPVKARPPWRPLLNGRLAEACTVAFTAQFAATALLVVVALHAGDRFGLSPTMRGLAVATFGVAGLASGRLVGLLADRFGVRRTGFAATLVLAGATAAAAWAPNAALLVACVTVAGVAGTGSRVTASSFALESTPANPSTATALSLSAQFLGAALSPGLVPLYQVSVVAALTAAAAVAATGAAVVLLRR